jgi:hypothetical protein
MFVIHPDGISDVLSLQTLDNSRYASHCENMKRDIKVGWEAWDDDPN